VTFAEAPIYSSSATTATWPVSDATIKGVIPLPACVFTFALSYTNARSTDS
jgi:hypothetical protein